MQSPSHLTEEFMQDVLDDPDPQGRLGGFVHALLEAYVKADPSNRAALTMGFPWLPKLHAACARL